jgi:hypothetical protein
MHLLSVVVVVCRSLRGKVLAAFLKCIGHIIPLMDAEHAYYYTKEVMLVLKREFSTADEEMKKIVLKVRGACYCLHYKYSFAVQPAREGHGAN